MEAFSGGSIMPDIDNSDTMQLIRQAVLFENEELLYDLLKENPEAVYKVDRHGRTPLMLAAHNGRSHSLQVLLTLSPETLEFTNCAGKTALHLAAESGEASCIKVLLESGGDLYLRDDAGHCALEAAQIAGHEQAAAVLIEAIQNENERVELDHKRLVTACIEGNANEVDSILTGSSERVKEYIINGKSANDDTALFVSCTHGHVEVVRKLLAIHCSHVLVNHQTKDTVIHAAISSQNIDVLNIVLEKFPALVANSNCDNCSCLHWAAENGNLEIVKKLLEFKYPESYLKEIDMVSAPPYKFVMDVNQGDIECRTAFYLAVAKGHLEVVQYMFQFQCDFIDGTSRCPFQIDVYCNRGRTPLMIAAFNQNFPMLTHLIDNGADINLPLAVLESDINVEEARCVGSGALVEATRADAVHIVHYLLDKGALDTDNRALGLAASKNNEKLVRIFLTRLVFPDPEYKVNKRNVDVGQIQLGQNLLPSALCPSKAAMLNWGSAGLESVQADWFIAAALQINPRLRTTRLSLAAITRIDLSANNLTIFPTVLFQMPSLRLLNLSENKIKTIDLPSYYVSSTALEVLHLKSNEIENISTNLLLSLPKLSVLDVSYNNITSLPEFIWLCPSLKELNVSFNQLSSLPIVGSGRGRGNIRAPAGMMPHSVSTTTVDTSDMPDNVTSKSLQRVNVWQEKINLSKVDDDDLFPDFPVTSSNTLTTLNLSGNKFQAFPLCLACTCPRLTTLNMSFNNLGALPPISCIPAHLRNFDVSDNNLREGFQMATALHNVCHAVPPSQNSGGGFVRRNSPPQRHHRSRSKSAVRSQRSLSVSRNQQPDGMLEDACVHKRHDCLLRLKVINLNRNKLSSFNVTTKGKVLLPLISVIELSNNLLKTVSSEFSKLTTLSVLNISQNKDIKELPPELGMLSRLWSLSLKGCQLKEPLDSMVNTDNCKTVEIVAYLKTILEESKTFRHLKLVILGEESVGKSSLWESFRSEGVQKRPVVQTESVRLVEWKYEAKRSKNEPNLGPVSFAALDFLGQREYYATHPYFATRRSVYLVVWRVPEGDAAFTDVQKWLVSIQARAPNSCVILVGTHIDQVAANPNRFPPGFLEDVELKVRRRFMVSDSDKRGLPKIMDLLFINTKNKQDIKTLLNVVYKSAWEVRVGKERALDQQIPSSYIALLKIVRDWAIECRKDQVTSCFFIDDFKEHVKKRMISKFGRFFRDDIEFHAACSFLHDSGEIIHYEDAALRQVVFIDLLWLSDFLARCASLKTNNLPVGLITQETLTPLGKQLRSHVRPSLLDLLHKFELALVCHSRQLILPSLLPDEYQLRSDYTASSVKLPAKMSQWQVRYPNSLKQPFVTTKAIFESQDSFNEQPGAGTMFNFCYEKKHQLRRLYVMAYIPAGFWSRLITRIMGDQNVSRAIELLFASETSSEGQQMQDSIKKHLKVEWLIWKSGIELLIKGHSVFVLKQFFSQAEVRDVDYSSLIIQVRDDQKRWCPFPITDWTTIEMLFPTLSITAIQGGAKATMRSDVEGRTRLCALIVDLVDTLLEDWYPALGTRFVHSSEGVLLVNRLVPCYKCVDENNSRSRRSQDDNDVVIIKREDSYMRASKTSGDMRHVGLVNCFTIEECMLAGRESQLLECPSHGGIENSDIAPDTIFVDIESSLLIPQQNIKRGRMLGRGAFGFVFRATVKIQSGELTEVAQKMLEPVDPGPGGKPSAITAYKAAADKWRREALEFACRAYCTSRQELNLLCRMRHSNVIGLIGVCVSPLSLVVELAPLGALNQLLSSHRKSGAKLSLPVIRESAVQVARALEYLHLAHIIYRDLKSENVLGWRFPAPFSNQTDVLLKLGDYGISRSVLPSGGAKGFGGTEGFMAPEIVRFNGEEEYTQKVDVFSFSMFLYELLTLKQPFEGEEHVKERLLDGARPVLLPHELLVPCSMLDLLVHCWDSQPDARPSSSQVVGFCSAPEFSHILDICELKDTPPTSILSVPLTDDLDDPEDFEAQVWLGGKELTVMSCTQYAWVEQKEIKLTAKYRFLSKIRETIWACEENSSDVIMFTPSLHEAGKLQLPSLGSPMIKPPEFLGSELLLLVCQHEITLLQLSPSNSVALRGTMRSSIAITSAVFVNSPNHRQIWTGHGEGRITIHNLSNEDTFSFSSSLYLRENDVTIKEMIASRDGAFVWISFVNDTRIYCFDVERRQVNSSLDIKKVVPGSETIHTMDMEVASNNYVTSMSLLERSEGIQLYIGTLKGLLIVAQALMLQPISACRPFEQEICYICVLEGPRDEDFSGKGRGSLSTASSDGSLGWVRERVSETIERLKITSPVCNISSNALVATVGKGFRSLSHRFVSETQLSDLYSVAIWRTDDWT